MEDQLAGLHLVRLTDNYIAFCTSPQAAEHAAARITDALVAHRLAPNLAKSKAAAHPRRRLPGPR